MKQFLPSVANGEREKPLLLVLVDGKVEDRLLE
jgi:hypothetical protein